VVSDLGYNLKSMKKRRKEEASALKTQNLQTGPVKKDTTA